MRHVLMSRHAALLLSLASLLAEQATAQQELWRMENVLRRELFGSSIALLPDRDGDGIDDLAVGVPCWWDSADSGRVRVLSGRDLSLQFEIAGPPTLSTRDQFGYAVIDGGDLNGDRIHDILVGAPNRDLVFAYSGADGHELARYTERSSHNFGSTLAAMGDLDKDGVGDFAIGCPDESLPGGGWGAVRLISGANGALIRKYDSGHGDGRYGARDRMSSIGDVDGDGFDDLVLLDMERTGTYSYPVVEIKSGGTAAELLSVPLDSGQWTNYYCNSVTGVGDQDGDGKPDFMLGSIDTRLGNPCIGFVLSSSDGQEITRCMGITDGSPAVAGASVDHDGDGKRELVIGCYGQANIGQPDPSFRLFHGGDGVLLAELIATGSNPKYFDFSCFAAGGDLNGDAEPDLVVGISIFAPANEDIAGAVEIWTWDGVAPIARREGESEWMVASAAAQLGDVNGDGASDIVAFTEYFDPALRACQLHSGRDGSLLATHLTGGTFVDGVAGLPDLDGDGIVDYARGYDDRIELCSSASGAVIRTCLGPTGGWGRTLRFHPVVTAAGFAQLGVGTPYSNQGKSLAGEFNVFDLATGTLLFRKVGIWKSEYLGYSATLCDDVNGDGQEDWMVGAPRNGSSGMDAGRVVTLNGKNGGQLGVWFGAAGEWFGAGLAEISDYDRDGTREVAISAPGAGPVSEGEVRAVSPISGAVLSTFSGSRSQDRFGDWLTPLGDLNRDGTIDFAALANRPERFNFVNGATGGRLYVLDLEALGYSVYSSILGKPEFFAGSANGDGHADLLLFDPPLLNIGQLRLLALDDLMLQIDPPAALAGDVVTAWLCGGIPSSPLGLELVAVDGVPVGQLVTIASFNVAGEWSLKDTVPSGLGGTSIDLRGWAIDGNGRLISSPVQRLEFE